MTTAESVWFQCEMWFNGPTNAKGRRTFGTCSMSPVVVIVDINIVPNWWRCSQPKPLCARCAHVYFWILNKRRGNDDYAPFVAHREREEARRRSRMDRELTAIRERELRRRQRREREKGHQR